ncbi:unnamed protein product [Vicia faba]|uniref:Uncharacterized protein n=1 Tax=Vicia faba TaxID=3906 RepID=A0AAV0ZG49_VICFA|nr:unnamed protein product [Vicia faba]
MNLKKIGKKLKPTIFCDIVDAKEAIVNKIEGNQYVGSKSEGLGDFDTNILNIGPNRLKALSAGTKPKTVSMVELRSPCPVSLTHKAQTDIAGFVPFSIRMAVSRCSETKLQNSSFLQKSLARSQKFKVNQSYFMPLGRPSRAGNKVATTSSSLGHSQSIQPSLPSDRYSGESTADDISDSC